MVTTMFCMAVGAVANIILDPIFISGLGPIPEMGVMGAALATGIGQCLSLLAYLIVFWRANIPVKIRLGKPTKEKIAFKLYAVGIPASLNMALPSFMITLLNAILAAFAETYVLILGVYYKLQTFIYFTVSGIVQGIRPLVGYNLGAGRRDRVLSIFRLTLLLSIGVMTVGTILCLAIPRQLMGLFSETDTTIEAGASALRIISAGFIVSALPSALSRHRAHRLSSLPPLRRRRRVARLLGDGAHLRHPLLPPVLRMLFEKTPEGERTKHAKNRMKKTPLMLRRFCFGENCSFKGLPPPFIVSYTKEDRARPARPSAFCGTARTLSSYRSRPPAHSAR